MCAKEAERCVLSLDIAGQRVIRWVLPGFGYDIVAGVSLGTAVVLQPFDSLAPPPTIPARTPPGLPVARKPRNSRGSAGRSSGQGSDTRPASAGACRSSSSALHLSSQDDAPRSRGRPATAHPRAHAQGDGRGSARPGSAPRGSWSPSPGAEPPGRKRMQRPASAPNLKRPWKPPAGPLVDKNGAPLHQWEDFFPPDPPPRRGQRRCPHLHSKLLERCSAWAAEPGAAVVHAPCSVEVVL
mmetsp:Transcript_16726/g.41067  ORF Transcript_16726/g.41067 Transcript_16726/m.41067 type:complete len:240 (-) Transcript_16726:66-785(-)